VSVISSFEELLQCFAVAFTAPSFQTLTWLVTGWLFARRRTITRLMVAAGVVGKKHHSAFHRLFATARWSLDELGLILFMLLQPWLGEVVFLAVDDTLARKRGLKVFGVGMHHDPLLSSRNKAIMNWGHSWVILAVLVRFPLWPERVFAIPVLFRLYLNKKAAAKHRREYRSRPELALELLGMLCNRYSERCFHTVADSAYGGQGVLTSLPSNCDLTSRLVMDARLYTAAPTPAPGQKGRPRKRGQRLPTPSQMLEQRAQRQTLTLYGRRDRVRLVDTVAYVHAAPACPLRIVAVAALSGGRKPQAFYSTCHTATAVEVLTWYAQRWAIEVAFHDSKQHLGFEEPQNWSRRAVERTAPLAMLLYGLVVIWFARVGRKHYQPRQAPWYTTKRQPSFADMLATLRSSSVRERIFSLALKGAGSRKIKQTVKNAVLMAA